MRPALLALATLATLAALASPLAQARTSFEPGAGLVNDAWIGAWESADESWASLPHPGPTASFPGPTCPDVHTMGKEPFIDEAPVDVHTGYSFECPEGEPLLPERREPEPAHPAAAPAEAPVNVTEAENPAAPPPDRLEAAEPWEPASSGEAQAPAPEASRPEPGAAPAATAFAPAPPPQGRAPVALLALTAAAALLLPSALAFKLASLLGLRWNKGHREASPVQGAVLALIAQEPGLRHVELVRRIGKGNGTVEHHVERLLKAGQVRRMSLAGCTCYFPAGFADPHASLRAVVRAPTARRLAEAVQRDPGASLSRLAATLGLAVSTAHYHASRLVGAGLLSDSRRDGQRSFALTDAGRACLAPLPPADPPKAPPPAAEGSPVFS